MNIKHRLGIFIIVIQLLFLLYISIAIKNLDDIEECSACSLKF